MTDVRSKDEKYLSKPTESGYVARLASPYKGFTLDVWTDEIVFNRTSTDLLFADNSNFCILEIPFVDGFFVAEVVEDDDTAMQTARIVAGPFDEFSGADTALRFIDATFTQPVPVR